MPGDAAAVKRCAYIAERKVQRVTLQVMNEERMSRNAEPFANKSDNLIRLKVMEKKRAAHRVKAIITEGKRQSVSADGGVGVAQMRGSAVQNNRLRRYA